MPLRRKKRGWNSMEWCMGILFCCAAGSYSSCLNKRWWVTGKSKPCDRYASVDNQSMKSQSSWRCVQTRWIFSISFFVPLFHIKKKRSVIIGQDRFRKENRILQSDTREIRACVDTDSKILWIIELSKYTSVEKLIEN